MQASKPGREELQVNQFNQNVPKLLLKFAKQGRLADLEDLIVKFLQEARSCVNQLDNSGLCPLHYAARNGQLGCIRKLVELLSADVNIESRERKTALHFAAMHRRRVQNDAHSSEHKTENDSGIHEPPALDSKEHLHRHAKEQKPLSIPSCPVRPSGSCPLVRFLLEHGAHVNAKDILGRTSLHYAAIHGDELATRQLLHDVNIDVNIPDHNGTQPLHLAALHNEAGIFRQLLNKNANIYVEDHCGCLPIHYACSSGNLGLVEMLCGRLESNETVSMLNKKNRELETPLHWAVTYGNIQITDYCIKMGADIESKTKSGETCLHKAARCGNLELVMLLLDHGAVLDAEDELAQTPIHKAAEHNGAEVLRYLLKREIDTEVQDCNSYTPLLLCASNGHIDAAEVLIEAGANIFAQEAEGKNFVHLCVEENRLQFLKLFLGRPTADSVVHVADIFDRTPLHTAAEKGCVDILQLLIEHGAAIDAKDDRGRTTLHYAAEYGHLQIATCLLSICPQLLNSLDDASNTAAHYASKHGHSSLLHLLLNSGAMAGSQNNRCHTPLHYAAAAGHLDCAELLLKHNASVNPLEKSTVGPLHLSCRNGHVAMVELLLRWGAEPGIRITADVANIPAGSNALDAAIEGGHRSCAMALLRHSRWKSALRNQSISEFQVIQTPFRKLIAFMPDVAEFVLNKCEEDQAEKPYTFEFIDDQYAFWNEAALMGQVKLCFSKSPLNYILNKWRALNLSTTSQEPCQLNHTSTGDQSQQLYCNDFYLLKENHPLMYMIRYKRSRLLQHPAVTELLRVKWNQINLLYYFNLMLYIAFLASYSVYILKAKPLDAVIHQNHPILTDVQEGGTKRNEINAMPPALAHPIKREHNQAGINTDSWASSGQPLLSSDPDSSLSQLMLVNTGYTSSDSRCSMLQPQNVSTVLSSSGAQPVIGAPLPTYTLSVGDAQGTSEHGPRESVTSSTLSAMPATFGLEEAAGYVWPQWPTAFSGMHQVSSNADASSTNPTDPSDTDGLLSLNRQLWLRRSERQRLFYLRQLQLYRSMIGIPLPEQSIEEAVEEATSRRHQWRNQTLADPLNESDAEDLSDDRYCPDPTSNTATPHTSQT
ncbi:unnamed protein product [Dicrocoelium dendriticum]|nr:unnamed protein product [Dicrocoelium dendriticum]